MLNIGIAYRPKPGETECGDQIAVVEHDGAVVIAVADGLGHGPQAADAGRKACECVRDDPGLPLPEILRSCDHALRRTRGVAMTICRIERRSSRLQHAGVGNVEFSGLTRQSIRPITYPGIVGSGFRKVVETNHTLHPGDLFVVYTDGISSRCDLFPYLDHGAQDIADAMLREWAKDHDDAACVAVTV